MDRAMLKSRFGGQIAFWSGGVDAQHILPNGMPEEGAANVRQNIKTLAPRDGYVFNNRHDIEGEVPPENVFAMFDTATSADSIAEGGAPSARVWIGHHIIRRRQSRTRLRTGNRRADANALFISLADFPRTTTVPSSRVVRQK